MRCFRLSSEKYTWWFDAASKGAAWVQAEHLMRRTYHLQKNFVGTLYQNQTFVLGTCGKRDGKFFIETVKQKKETDNE